MANKWAQGKYTPKNMSKYAGLKNPTYRSSWEFSFCQFCDSHPSVVQWASEAIKIPYKHPITGKNTIYVPDFLVVYQDRHGVKKTELIEVKPSTQISMESAKNNKEAITIAVNQAKWKAAIAFCKNAKIQFRIITEKDLFKFKAR